MRRYPLSAALFFLATLGLQAQDNPRREAVLGDKQRLEADASWVYNDLNRGRELARGSGKPLLLLVRCLP
jgi:hypothetical protein